MNRFSQILAAPALIVLAATAASAQTLTLDEGTFVLRSGGREIGREVFTIRQNGTGSGSVIVAQGRVDLNDSDGLVTNLEVSGPSLRPASYQVQVEGDQPQKIAGRVAGGRFSARIVSPAGEMMREYLAGDGAVIIDEGVAHQNYFLARRLAQAPFRVPVIVPRQSRQVSTSVAAPTDATLSIGGKSVEARRFSVQPQGGDARTVWADSEGRILRVEIPSRDLVAERTELPG